MNNLIYQVINKRYMLSLIFVIIFFGIVQTIVKNNSSAFITIENNNIENEIEAFTSFVSIPNGASAADIASILKNAELIDNSITFEIYIRNEGYADRLRAGNYEIESNLTYETIVNILLIGPPLKTYEITTIEGLWLSEIIESISIQTGYDYSSLVNTLTSGSVESKYISLEMSKDINNWEGLLFPDTYKFPIEADGTEIFQKMVDQLEFQIIEIKNSKTLPNWLNSEYELFIVASLVETEAKLDEDRPLVSSVIRNRLELGMPLQIDSTVIYALGERRGQVLLKDLEVDSPYNTYLNSTLPPTPISSFSRASLESVYENLTTNFVYYLLTDKNGDMTFTQSYDEFLELKNKAKEDGVIP